jgi:hypothetical protein
MFFLYRTELLLFLLASLSWPVQIEQLTRPSLRRSRGLAWRAEREAWRRCRGDTTPCCRRCSPAAPSRSPTSTPSLPPSPARTPVRHISFSSSSSRPSHRESRSCPSLLSLSRRPPLGTKCSMKCSSGDVAPIFIYCIMVCSRSSATLQ